MDDYTDYHRYTWSVVKPPKHPFLTFLSRLPWYLAILTIIHFTYTARFFKEMAIDARILTFCVVTFIAFGLVAVFNRILNKIEISRGQQLIQYRIDRKGIHIGNRLYPITSNVRLQFPNPNVSKRATTALTHYRQTQYKR